MLRRVWRKSRFYRTSSPETTRIDRALDRAAIRSDIWSSGKAVVVGMAGVVLGKKPESYESFVQWLADQRPDLNGTELYFGEKLWDGKVPTLKVCFCFFLNVLDPEGNWRADSYIGIGQANVPRGSGVQDAGVEKKVAWRSFCSELAGMLGESEEELAMAMKLRFYATRHRPADPLGNLVQPLAQMFYTGMSPHQSMAQSAAHLEAAWPKLLAFAYRRGFRLRKWHDEILQQRPFSSYLALFTWLRTPDGIAWRKQNHSAWRTQNASSSSPVSVDAESKGESHLDVMPGRLGARLQQRLLAALAKLLERRAQTSAATDPDYRSIQTLAQTGAKKQPRVYVPAVIHALAGTLFPTIAAAERIERIDELIKESATEIRSLAMKYEDGKPLRKRTKNWTYSMKAYLYYFLLELDVSKSEKVADPSAASSSSFALPRHLAFRAPTPSLPILGREALKPAGSVPMPLIPVSALSRQPTSSASPTSMLGVPGSSTLDWTETTLQLLQQEPPRDRGRLPSFIYKGLGLDTADLKEDPPQLSAFQARRVMLRFNNAIMQEQEALGVLRDHYFAIDRKEELLALATKVGATRRIAVNAWQRRSNHLLCLAVAAEISGFSGTKSAAASPHT